VLTRSKETPTSIYTTILYQLESSVTRAGQVGGDTSSLGQNMTAMLRGLSRVQEEVVVTSLLSVFEDGHIPTRARKEVREGLQRLGNESLWFKSILARFDRLEKKLAPPAKRATQRISPRRVAVEAAVAGAR